MKRPCLNGALPCLCLIILAMMAVCHAQQQQQTQQRPTITVGGRQYYRDEYVNYYYSNYFYRRFYNYFANWYRQLRERIIAHLATVCPQQTALTTGSPTSPATTLQTTTITANTTQQSAENQTTASCTCPTTVPTDTNSTNTTVTPPMNITSTPATIDTPDNATANATSPLFRIPLAFYPDLYTLTLHPVAPAFDGYVRILMTCREATKKLYLHSSEIIISEDSLEFAFENGSSAGNILNVTYDKEMQYVIFDLSDESIPGLKYYIAMNYTGILQMQTLRGLFKEIDMPRNIEGAGFSKPYYARSIFPCFDEPAIKAQFGITLVRNEGANYFTLSTTDMIERTSRPGNYVAETYRTTRAHSTFTVALLVVKDVVSDDGITDGVMLSIKRRNVHENTTVHLLGKAAITKYISVFKGLFAVTDFPYANLDVFVSRQLYQDGVGNDGLIFFRESDFFYDESVSPASKKQTVVRLAAREIAQQFIGAQLTAAWWDDLGIFEGIARFFTYKGMSLSEDFQMGEQFVTDLVIPAFNRDLFYVSPPIYTPLIDARDLRKNLSPLSYQKTAALLRMMEFILGESEFKTRMQTFYNLYKGIPSTHKELLVSMTSGMTVTAESIERNLTGVLEAYIYQHSFPVIYAIASDPFDRIAVFPKKPTLYGYIEEAFPTPYDHQWTIPITYTHAGNVNFSLTNQDIVWIDSSQYTTPWANYKILDQSFGNLSSQWFIVNVKLLGYYRVKYDVSNYNNLKTKLASDSYTDIDPVNRAQIVSDFFYFAQGDSCRDLALFSSLLFEGMQNERHYIPLKATFEVIDSLDKLLKLDMLYPKFLAKVKPFVTGMFNNITMNATDPSLTHIEKLARELIIEQACRFGVEACVEESKRLFSEWMGNSTNNPIDPSIKEAVYCTAIREGSYDEWDFLYNRLKVYEEFTGPEAITMIRALTCTRDPSLIARFIESVIGDVSKVRNVWQTMQEAFVSLSGNPIAKCDVFEILREHFIEEIDILTFKRNMDDSGGMVRIFESIGKVSTTSKDRERLVKIRSSTRAALHSRLITVAIAQAAQNMYLLNGCREPLMTSMQSVNNT